jgi:hypothetical protein
MDSVVIALSRVVQSIHQPSTDIRPRLASRFERHLPRTIDIAWPPAVVPTNAEVTDLPRREPHADSPRRSTSSTAHDGEPIIPVDHARPGWEASVQTSDVREPNHRPRIRTRDVRERDPRPTIGTAPREQLRTRSDSLPMSPSREDEGVQRATESTRHLEVNDTAQVLGRAAPREAAVATDVVTLLPSLRPLEPSDDVSNTRSVSSTPHSVAFTPPRLRGTPQSTPGAARAAVASYEPLRRDEMLPAPRLSPYRPAGEAAPRRTDTIQITIGRVELRAVAPGATPRTPAPNGPTLRLDDYLRQRTEGRR